MIDYPDSQELWASDDYRENIYGFGEMISMKALGVYLALLWLTSTSLGLLDTSCIMALGVEKSVLVFPSEFHFKFSQLLRVVIPFRIGIKAQGTQEQDMTARNALRRGSWSD